MSGGEFEGIKEGGLYNYNLKKENILRGCIDLFLFMCISVWIPA